MPVPATVETSSQLVSRPPPSTLNGTASQWGRPPGLPSPQPAQLQFQARSLSRGKFAARVGAVISFLWFAPRPGRSGRASRFGRLSPRSNPCWAATCSPYAACPNGFIRAIRRGFNAAVTKFHSPCAFANPRIENSRNPNTRFTHPNAGSTSAFLRPYRLRPRWSRSRLRIRSVAAPPAFVRASPPSPLSRPNAT